MQEVIDKLKELIQMLEEPEHNWLDDVPENHRKFAAYWDEIGRPELEVTDCLNNIDWYRANPNWDNSCHYRIKNDPHWQLRLKWINSDKTLPIEFKSKTSDQWYLSKKYNCNIEWFSDYLYRESKPWYEQEISPAKPIVLKCDGGVPSIWSFKPANSATSRYRPLTDQEIDALKRGF